MKKWWPNLVNDCPWTSLILMKIYLYTARISNSSDFASFLNEGQLLKERFAPSFHPIALRIAKTLWSFGCSECNRVKSKLLLERFHCLLKQTGRSRSNLPFKK